MRTEYAIDQSRPDPSVAVTILSCLPQQSNTICSSLRGHRVLCAISLLGMTALPGCGTHMMQIASGRSAPLVIYCDGAGGGGTLTPWVPEMREGLLKADPRIQFEDFPWQTGLGVGADQAATISYKRIRGGVLASRICALRAENPLRPIHLVGLSAGTFIVLNALEQLPPDCKVDSAILLASSVSSTYDVTPALGHIRDRLYVFTSEHDLLLSTLVPIWGSADRVYCGRELVGICGFKPQPNASNAAELYSTKIVQIPWTPDFARWGNRGGHTDFVKPAFVEGKVAALIEQSARPIMASAQMEPEKQASSKSESPTATVSAVQVR